MTKTVYILILMFKPLFTRLHASKTAKAGLGYSIGNILVRGISFVTIPIFTYLMSVEDFGLYATFVAYESIFFLFTGLCLHSSIRSANQEYPDQLDTYVSSVTSLQILFFFLTLVIVIVLYLVDWDPLLLGFTSLLLMAIACFSSSVLSVYNNYLSISYNYKKYLVLSVFSALGNIIFSIPFILYVFPSERYLGRVAGTALSATVVAICVIFFVYKCARPTLKKNHLSFACRYSWPIIPHGLSQVILAQFARIIIQRTIGNTAAGLFGFAFTIASIPQVIASSLDTVWATWFFENFKHNRKLIRERAVLYLAFFSFITMVITTLAPEAVYLLAPQPYWDAQLIVIPAVMCTYVMFLYCFPATIEYYRKKTTYIAQGSALSAIANIALNLYCIPKYGYVSSVYVTLLTYILYLIFHLIMAYRLEGSVYALHPMGLLVALTSALAIADHLLMDNLPGRTTLFLLATLALCFLFKKQLHKFCRI